MLDETTRTKFLFYGGNDYQASGGLSEFISVNDMPDFLGGPCKVRFYEFLNYPSKVNLCYNFINIYLNLG